MCAYSWEHVWTTELQPIQDQAFRIWSCISASLTTPECLPAPPPPRGLRIVHLLNGWAPNLGGYPVSSSATGFGGPLHRSHRGGEDPTPCVQSRPSRPAQEGWLSEGPTWVWVCTFLCFINSDAWLFSIMSPLLLSKPHTRKLEISRSCASLPMKS